MTNLTHILNAKLNLVAFALGNKIFQKFKHTGKIYKNIPNMLIALMILCIVGPNKERLCQVLGNKVLLRHYHLTTTTYALT
jgi:hypothetical protein